MKTSATPARHPVLIVETIDFEQRVSSLLTPIERRGLLLLLADDPVRGDTIANFPGLLQLRYAGCVIFYVVAPGFLKVYLLNIEKEDAGSAPPTKEEAGLLRKLLVLLGKGAVIAGVKKGVKWLWEYWRDGSPPSL